MLWTEMVAFRLLWMVKTIQRVIAGVEESRRARARGGVGPEGVGRSYS